MSSSLADRWTFLDTFIQQRRFRQIEGLIPAGCVLADMGCGDGSFLRQTAARISSGYGLDRSVDRAAGPQKLSFLPADLNREIPLKTGLADVVTAFALLEHLAAPEHFIREIHRVLKTGGCCLLTTPAPRARPVLEFLAYRLKVISEKDIRDHAHYFTRQQLRDLFSAFARVRITSFQLGFNTLIVACK